MPSRNAIIGAIVTALVAVALGIWLSFEIHWFPVAATIQAHNTDRLYHVLVIATIPIFVLVVGVILFSVWQFRMRPGEELKDGPPIHGNTRLEVFWTALPAALLLSMVAYSFVVLYDNEKKPAGVPEIQIGVTGQQFFWTYEYPSAVTGGAPLRSYQLYLPAGDTVYFNMRSRDVIHAFWIPAFRVQEDVVPGITTHYRATLNRLGDYPVVCNLLCGVGHSLMRSVVHVVTRARFQAWLRSQAGKSSNVATASSGGAPSPRSTALASLSASPAEAIARRAIAPGIGR
jgi:cytochrome c oxidase subunit II